MGSSLRARRSLYCSKHANGPHSITKTFAGDALRFLLLAEMAGKLAFHFELSGAARFYQKVVFRRSRANNQNSI